MWNMEIGGAERAVYQLIRGQLETGINANVLICNSLGYYGERVRDAGAKVISLGMRSTFDALRLSAFKQALVPFDLVHFHSCEPLLMNAVPRNREKRLVYTHRGGAFEYPWIKPKLRMWACKGPIRSRFFAVSGNTRQGANAAAKLFGLDPEKVKVTYNGIEFGLIRPSLPKLEVLSRIKANTENKIIIATSANLRPWKRIDYLLRAIKAVDHSQLLTLIIGDGPDKQRLETMTRDLKLEREVLFVGKQSNVFDYLQLADIFVLPSNSAESFGNSAIEAMAMGIPTIVMKDGGGLVEHIDDGASGFIADDEADLQCKLSSLIESESLRKSLGAAGERSVKQKYSVKNMIASYSDLYAGAIPAGEPASQGRYQLYPDSF
jgi:glycosyltransferase involved in cell wall biosynthesis